MDILLNNGEIICIDGDARNLVVSSHAGHLWVTQPGDPNDHMIAPGDHFTISRKGKIAVTAIDNARLHITCPLETKQACQSWQILTA